MRKNKSIICIGISIVFLVAIIFSLFKIKDNEEESDEKKFIIGMSQSNLYEPWRINMNEEIQEEAKKHKDLKMVYKDAGGDVEKQKQDINDLINFGVDLLIVSINDSEELTPTVKEAYKSIPVIVLDRAVEGYDYTLYIGGDIRSIGEQAGHLVAKLANNSNIKVMEVQGVLNSSPDEEMSNGFKEVISKYRNISIDRTIVANWNKNDAQDKLQELLKDENDIDVIFAHSDYMALGAYYAVQKMGRNNIKIIGVDGLEGKEGGIELVRRGVFEGTYTCKTGGKEAVEYAIKILNKDQDIPKKVLLECNEITRDTLK